MGMRTSRANTIPPTVLTNREVILGKGPCLITEQLVLRLDFEAVSKTPQATLWEMSA